MIEVDHRNHAYYLNEYELVRDIDRGQQSKNYIVQNAAQKQYFLQILPADDQSLRRLHIMGQIQQIPNTAQMLFYLDRPKVVYTENIPSGSTILEIVQNNHIFIFYELYEYDELSQNTFTHFEKGSPALAFKQKLTLFYQLCLTVQQLHNINIYHFDIKPENILTDGTNFKLIDFGGAQQIQPNHQTQQFSIIDGGVFDNAAVTFTCVGSKLFSPLRFDSQSQYVSARKYDVYSLGCVLYFMLTKKYLQSAIHPQSKQTKKFIEAFGWAAFNLLQAMTESDFSIRYDIDQVLGHPLFSILKDLDQYIDGQQCINTRMFFQYDVLIKMQHLAKVYARIQRQCRRSQSCMRMRYNRNGKTIDDTIIEQTRSRLDRDVSLALFQFTPGHGILQKRPLNRWFIADSGLASYKKQFLINVSVCRRFSNHVTEYLNQQVASMSLLQTHTYLPRGNSCYHKFISNSSISDELYNIYCHNFRNSALSINAGQIINQVRKASDLNQAQCSAFCEAHVMSQSISSSQYNSLGVVYVLSSSQYSSYELDSDQDTMCLPGKL